MKLFTVPEILSIYVLPIHLPIYRFISILDDEASIHVTRHRATQGLFHFQLFTEEEIAKVHVTPLPLYKRHKIFLLQG